MISCGTGIVCDSIVSERNPATLASCCLVETVDFETAKMKMKKLKNREKGKANCAITLFILLYMFAMI